MNQAHYDVQNILNSEVKTQVKNVLNDIEGVQKVNVDTSTGSIDVDFKETADESEIREGIKRVGCKID